MTSALSARTLERGICSRSNHYWSVISANVQLPELCQVGSALQVSSARVCRDTTDGASADHFMCRDEACLEQKFVVFGSELDLRAHTIEAVSSIFLSMESP